MNGSYNPIKHYILRNVLISNEINVSAGSVVSVSASLEVIPGYTPVGIVGISIWDSPNSGYGYGYADAGAFYVDNGSAWVFIHNVSATMAIKVMASTHVLYLKD